MADTDIYLISEKNDKTSLLNNQCVVYCISTANSAGSLFYDLLETYDFIFHEQRGIGNNSSFYVTTLILVVSTRL